MSSNSGPSSFALVAFSSSFTLLISHLAVRQGPQVVHQPVSQPVPQSPPVIAPPPPPPPQPVPPTPPNTAPPLSTPPALLPPSTLIIPSNSAQILYILVILVLFFGLSGVWLDSLGQSGRSSNRDLRQKKKGYVSSSDGEDDDDDFPGGWRSKKERTNKMVEDERKDWKTKMKSKVKEWEESIKMKTMSDKIKGKQRAKDDEENDQEAEVRTDERGKVMNEVACCGCCRILLDKCEQREKAREKDQNTDEKIIEQAWSLQVESQDNKQASTSEKKKETQISAISSTAPTAISSPGKASTEGLKTPGSTVQQSRSAKEKGKAKEATTDEIVEPPEPMPENDDVSVAPLTEDTAVAAVISAGGKGSSTSDKGKVSEEVTQKDGNKGDKGKEQESKGKGEETKEGQKVQLNENKQDGTGSLTKPATAKEEGKILKGLHYISDVTKDITEEVLKQVFAQLDGRHGVTKQAKSEDLSNEETPVTVVDTLKDSKADAEERKTDKTSEGKKSETRPKIPLVEALTEGEDVSQANNKKTKESAKGVKEGERLEEALLQTSSSKVGQEGSSNEIDKPRQSNESTVGEDKTTKPGQAKTTPENDKVIEGTTGQDKDKSKGKGKEEAPPPGTEKLKAPALDLQDCEPVLESAIQILLQSLKEQSAGKNLYYKAADHLAGSYKGVVEKSSEYVNKSLDEDFVSASNKANVKVKLPWYPIKSPYEDDTKDAEPHQDGKEPKKTLNTCKSEAKEASESSSDKKDREAIMRALDLWHIYKEESEKDEKIDSKKDKGKGKAEIELLQKPKKDGVPVSKKDEVNGTSSDAMLKTMIESLLQDKQTEQAKGAEIKNWSSRVAVEVAASDTPSSKSSSAYPNIIPLEAVNVSSLAKAGVLSKHRDQIEKQSRRSEGVKSAVKETRKNIYQIKDDLVVDIKEGATSKAKVLKSLLKKKMPKVDESNGKEVQGQEVKKEAITPRKIVRLQDAAGRGEGPRDISRGETEEAARYRRLREMAKRLND